MGRVIIAQYGARRRYHVAQMLEKNGLLEALYTDSNAYSILGRIGKLLQAFGLRIGSLTRLAKRNPGINPQRLRSYDGLQIRLFVNKLLKRPLHSSINLIFEGSSREFIKWGTGKAKWLYAMFIENIAYSEHAKQSGLKVIADIYENPYIWRELETELELPEYECIRNEQLDFVRTQAALREKYLDRLLKIADYYVVPGKYVEKCISQSPEYSAAKVRIIPYSSSIDSASKQTSPQKGRIIWIGNDPSRKGLVYCQRAAKILKKKYPFIDFRIIGPMPKSIIESNEFRDLHFIGYCNKEQLTDEFNKADVFVFPTLAEGFAGVLLEAASFGVPVITTESSGCSEDYPAIIIDRRDVDGIVGNVSMLLEDRQKRDALSEKTYRFSHNSSISSFERDLISLILEE